MKDVVILTLHNANNIGAYLQAYSLQRVIEKATRSNVKFGIFPSVANANRKNMLQKIMRYLKQRDIRKLRYKAMTASMYKEVQAVFSLVTVTKDSLFDAVVVGSDEMWNISNPSFVHHPQYFGHEINAKRIISYAPCSQSLTLDAFRKILPREDLSCFTHLSARDLKTKELAEKLSGREVASVVDPTMLIDDFEHVLPECPERGDFILVYSYELLKDQVKKVKDFAAKKNLRIISVGTYSSWADKNVVASPWLFLSYLKAAKYVVATTFHGTLLSIKFNKNFVCFTSGNGNPNTKVIEVLNLYNLGSRDMLNSCDLNSAFNTPIDYVATNRIIAETRRTSMEFLLNALSD